MDYYLAQRQQQFTRIHHRLQQQHPHLRLARQQTLLFKLQRRMEDGMQQQLRLAARRSERAQQRLAQVQPQGRIHRYQQRVQQQEYRLQQAMERQLNAYRQRFGVACSQLETVSPLATSGARLQRDANPARRAAENHQTGAGRRTAENPPAGWLGGKRGENHHRRQKPRKKRAAE